MLFRVDETSGKVIATAQAMLLEEVKELYSSDKHEGKRLFANWITYVYFVYSRDSMFANEMISKRKESVCKRFFPELEPAYFDSNNKIQQVVEVYLRLQYNHWELLYETWKKDVDDYIRYLSSIPYFTEHTDKDTGQVIQTPNIKEKKEAQLAIQNLVDTGKSLEEKIWEERKKQKKEISKTRKFDN